MPTEIIFVIISLVKRPRLKIQVGRQSRFLNHRQNEPWSGKMGFDAFAKSIQACQPCLVNQSVVCQNKFYLFNNEIPTQ